MSSSPSSLNWDEYENSKILTNFFIPNGHRILGQTWEEAEESCRNQNNSHLVTIPDPNTLARVQIFIQNLKNNPIHGKIAGYWILAQESLGTQKVCQIVTEFAEIKRVSCSDSVDDSGAIYIGLCERKLNSKQKKTADFLSVGAAAEVTRPHNVYTCQCEKGYG